jgi:hypothetical protein
MKNEEFAAAINDGSRNGMATSSMTTALHIHRIIEYSSLFTLNS